MVSNRITGTYINTKCGDLLLRCNEQSQIPSSSAINNPFGIFANGNVPFGGFTSAFTQMLPDMSGLPPLSMPPTENFYPCLLLSTKQGNPPASLPTRRTNNTHEVTTPHGSTTGQGNRTQQTSGVSGKTKPSKFPQGEETIRSNSELVNCAASFVNRVNSDKEGNRLFSGGKTRAWCADFVNYCMRQTYGNNCPKWVGSSRVYDLKKDAKKHNAYIELPKSGRANYIAKNIKPGDIMILLKASSGDCSGHTGIVERVNPNGTFVVIEGNSGNINGGQVQRVTYRPTSKTLRGFIRV